MGGGSLPPSAQRFDDALDFALEDGVVVLHPLKSRKTLADLPSCFHIHCYQIAIPGIVAILSSPIEVGVPSQIDYQVRYQPTSY
ncbi:MAG: hypothetical protein U0521_12895 [Anaerolineae bacterium]